MEHDSLSPEAILVTFKRFHENLGIYEEKISYPSDLLLYEVDTLAYDQLLSIPVLRKANCRHS
ncbi:MAG: hypothetical protein GX992_04415 [Clostridium sp.]|nr:hypothetical protein [Clostridium sp.]